MMKSNQFYRQGFKDVRESVEGVMENQFKSSIVDDLKSSNYVMERDGVKVYLAKVRWMMMMTGAGDRWRVEILDSVLCSNLVNAVF